MAEPSIDLRRRLVEACLANKSTSRAAIASLFGVDEATVERLIRLYEETGDVLYRSRGGNHPRLVDLEWLRRHLEDYPDARLVDRIQAWTALSGKPVSIGAMWLAVRACGWVHKDRQWEPERKTAASG